MDISGFIFVSVFMMTFGYIVGNARNITFWKFLPLAIVLIPFVHDFNLSKTHLMVIAISFVIGYLLPYAYLLEGFFDHLYDAINAIRYKDILEDIKRREAEVEKMRREYEQAQHQANQEKQNYERARREEEARQYRENNKQQEQQKQRNKSDSSQQEKKSNKRQSSPPPQSKRTKYLLALMLDPDKKYTMSEIKFAYRRQANKYHPDKHFDASDEKAKEVEEKTKLLNEAMAWFKKNGAD